MKTSEKANVNTRKRTKFLGEPGYDTSDPILAAYLIARGHQVCEVKSVRCDCERCEEVEDWREREPDDCYARRDWPVFSFVESLRLLADVQDFEAQRSEADLAEVIEKARKR